MIFNAVEIKNEDNINKKITEERRKIKKDVIKYLGDTKDLHKRKPSPLIRFEKGYRKFLFSDGSKFLDNFPYLKKHLKKKIDERMYYTKISVDNLDYLNYKIKEGGKNSKLFEKMQQNVKKSHNYSILTKLDKTLKKSKKEFKLKTSALKSNSTLKIYNMLHNNSNNNKIPIKEYKKGYNNVLPSFTVRDTSTSKVKISLNKHIDIENTNSNIKSQKNNITLKSMLNTNNDCLSSLHSDFSMSSLNGLSLKSENNYSTPIKVFKTSAIYNSNKSLSNNFSIFSASQKIKKMKSKNKMMQKLNSKHQNIIKDNFELNTLINDNINEDKKEKNKKEKEELLNDSIYKINKVLEVKDRNFNFTDQFTMKLKRKERINALFNLMKYYINTEDELSTKLVKPFVLIYNNKIHNKNLSLKDDYLDEINMYTKENITHEMFKRINTKKRLNKNNIKIEQLKTKIQYQKKDYNNLINKIDQQILFLD